MNEAQLLTLAEAAELSRTPEATLRWRRSQNLKPSSFKLGRRVMYKRSDVEAWIAEAYESGTATTDGQSGAGK